MTETTYAELPRREVKEPIEGVGIIMIQGMADLGGAGNSVMAGILGARAFDPRWHSEFMADKLVDMEQPKQQYLESLKQVEEVAAKPDEAVNREILADKYPHLWERLIMLNREVENIREQGKQVVLVPISAGGGLAMAYDKFFPGKIRFMCTIGGVINPDPASTEAEFPNLVRDSMAFGEMAEVVNGINEEGGFNRLKDRMVAFVAEKEDGIVPKPALEPDWPGVEVKKVKVGSFLKRIAGEGHVGAIAQALLREVKQRSEQWQQAELR